MEDFTDHSESIKRQRKSNFGQTELDLFVDEVVEKYSVLNAPFSSTITNSRKNAVWQSIAEKINATCMSHRTPADLRKKWNDLKCQTKKKAQKFQKARTQTGGGPPPAPMNDLDLKVLSLIPTCQLEGIPGGLETGANGLETTSVSGDAATPAPPSTISTSQWVEPVAADEEAAVYPSTSQQSLAAVPLTEDGSISQPLSLNIKTGMRKEKSQKSESDVSVLIDIEREKLAVLKERAATEKERLTEERRRGEVELQRLHVEERRLAVEERRLQLEENRLSLSPPFSLSPQIKF